jgi:hypothetical protein
MNCEHLAHTLQEGGEHLPSDQQNSSTINTRRPELVTQCQYNYWIMGCLYPCNAYTCNSDSILEAQGE